MSEGYCVHMMDCYDLFSAGNTRVMYFGLQHREGSINL